jgi:hypothetical protein
LLRVLIPIGPRVILGLSPLYTTKFVDESIATSSNILSVKVDKFCSFVFGVEIVDREVDQSLLDIEWLALETTNSKASGYCLGKNSCLIFNF